MKKLFTLSILISVFVSSFSQITYNITDVPVAPSIQRIAQDTFPLPSINFGNKGINQVYNFSNLVLFKYDTAEFRTPTGSQLSTCPNADVATTADGINFLLTNTDNTNNKLTLEGFEGQICAGQTISAAYSTKPDLFHFPTTYQSNFSGTGHLTKTVTASQVCQSFPVQNVRLTTDVTYTDTIDGWGKVITPLGAYKCLRKQRKETVHSLIEADIFLSGWTTVSDVTNTTVRYTYVTKEAKGSVINFNYDTANVLQSVNWSMTPPAAPLPNFSDLNVSGGLVSFTDLTDGYPDTYSWNFGDGSGTSSAQNPNHTYPANGAYYVCLTVTNAGGSNTYCDSVHVTNISAINNPPVAYNDTASVLQPNGLIRNVGNNDVDPDGNNICITSIYGSSAFTIPLVGNCTTIQYTPDSTFVGNDTCYYILCDNGIPVLCDTGMFVVNSVYNPALLPTASFTNGTFTYATCMGALLNSTSGNSDSLVWNFHPLNSNPDSSYTNTNSVHYYGMYSFGNNIQVCLTAYNQFGNSTHCDTVGIGCTDNISEVQLSSIMLYPNPATNLLTIDMRNNNDEAVRNYSAIEIYNALGEKVKSVNDRSKTINISVAELTNGVYLATLVDANGARRMLGRFVVEK